jgi:hypothetical protein
MIRAWMLCLVVSGLALLGAEPLHSAPVAQPQVSTLTAQSEKVLATYTILPKGVVLEGTAVGMEEISSCTYDKEQNALLINGKTPYPLPCKGREFYDVLNTIKKDDLLGVTLIDGQARFWGKVSSDSALGRALIDADHLMGGMIYGYENLVEKFKLPNNFKPQRAEDRKVPVVAVTRIWEYRFELKGGKYVRTDDQIEVQIFPLGKSRSTATGGHLPDAEEMKHYQREPTDRANLEYLQQHKAEFYKQTPLGDAARFGEAAAVCRSLVAAKVDVDALLKQLKK